MTSRPWAYPYRTAAAQNAMMLTTAPIVQPMAKNTAPMAVNTVLPRTCPVPAAAMARSARSAWIRSGSGGAGRSLRVVMTFLRSRVG